MRQLFNATFATVVLASAACHATILMTDDFSYPDGSLTTVSGDWSTHSGTAGQIQVSSGSISLTDSQSEDVNRSIGTTIAAGNVYAAFDFSVNAGAPAGGSDFEYFASFGNGTSDFTSRMDVTGAGGAGDFRVGISGASATAQATWATDLNFNTLYRAVIEYNRDTGISTLWIDPASTLSAAISSLADTNDVTGFYFRESNSSVNETITIDNLIVATTFNEATGIPEPSAGMLLLSAAGLLLGGRRRR